MVLNRIRTESSSMLVRLHLLTDSYQLKNSLKRFYSLALFARRALTIKDLQLPRFRGVSTSPLLAIGSPLSRRQERAGTNRNGPLTRTSGRRCSVSSLSSKLLSATGVAILRLYLRLGSSFTDITRSRASQAAYRQRYGTRSPPEGCVRK